MSVVYGAIVFAIALVFVVQFRPGSGRSTASLTQQCAITVGDRCVEPKEFFASIQLAVPRGVDAASKSDIRRAIAEGIVERILLAEDAERLRITVSDEEIDAELSRGRFRVSVPQTRIDIGVYLGLLDPKRLQRDPVADAIRERDVTANGKFDYKTYQRVVRLSTNRSPAEFRVMQKEELVAQRVRQLIASRASVTDAEAFTAYRVEKSAARLSYVRLDKNYYASNYVDTSQASVDSWSKLRQQEIEKSWNSRKASFPPGCVKARHILVRVKSDTVRVGHDRETAAGLIEKARDRLIRGDAFPIVAAEYSEDARTASYGGDLGCLTEGKMPRSRQNLEQLVLAQTRSGLIDTIVETDEGFHVVSIDMILPADEVQAESMARAYAAKELMVAFVTQELVLESAKRIRDAAKGGTDLDAALQSELALMDREHRPLNAAVKNKASKASSIVASEGPKENESRPLVETSAWFSPVDPSPIAGVDPGVNVVDLAFHLKKPGDVADDLVLLINGYAVVQLKDIKPATREDFETERESYIGRLRAAKQHDLIVSYVDQLRKNAGKPIVVSERWVQEPKRQNSDSDDGD